MLQMWKGCRKQHVRRLYRNGGDILILPKNKRGSTFFWGLLLEGETGVDLALRLPPPPEDMTEDDIRIWAKVSTGDYPLVILGVDLEGKVKPCSCAIDRKGEVQP